MTLAIKDWDTLFSKGDNARKQVIQWRYVPIPVNLNGERFRVLMATTKGQATFGIFVALVELAANLPRRGVLADDRGDLSIRAMAIKTGVPERSMEAAIAHLSSPDIGWLVDQQISGQPPETIRGSSGDHPGEIRATSGAFPGQQSRAEQREEEKQSRAEPPPEFRSVTEPERPAGVISQGTPACLPVCPDSMRGVLDFIGVGEPALSQLAASSLDRQVAWDEWGRIRTRRQIRDPVGVFVAWAAKLAGITLSKTALAPGVLSLIAETRRKATGGHMTAAEANALVLRRRKEARV